MLLTVDIGNTNITLGAFSGEELIFTARLATDKRRTADQYAVEINLILGMKNCDVSVIEGVVISSVVPSVGDALYSACEKLFGVKPLAVGPGVKSGLNIKIDNPAQLGADLVAGAVGAQGAYDMPCIIFDLGTATTVSVLDKDGNMLGGSIAAGMNVTLDALAEHTAQLPQISLEAPHSVIGTNTVDSMKSGIVIGTAAMIDGMVARIERELGCSASVVATGGLAPVIVPLCERDVILDESLLLRGMKTIWERNRKSNGKK